MSILSFSILIPAFLSIIIIVFFNVPDGNHNDALPRSRSLFSHGHGQPDARAAMVVKIFSKASLPLRGKCCSQLSWLSVT